ncbi:hypothetical protein [Streptomyces sp. enrichment culture]|uniref:hypothetical protein n=1 Tax=Streptomyces sp. enrichment culture TaxID=1795815 RepID=UPI003F56CAE3
MQQVDIVEVEAARHDWARMACGCGRTAEHIPVDFISALREPPSGRAGEGWADNHSYVQSNLMQPAAATTCIVMAALAGGVPAEHRRQLFVVLAHLVNGEQDDVADECLDVVKSGLWLLYEEISSGRDVDAASYAFEILELVEGEGDHLAHFREFVKGNLSPDLQ